MIVINPIQNQIQMGPLQVQERRESKLLGKIKNFY